MRLSGAHGVREFLNLVCGRHGGERAGAGPPTPRRKSTARLRATSPPEEEEEESDDEVRGSGADGASPDT